MKIILLDTNIYGLALERKDVAMTLVLLSNEKQKPEKEHIVLGSEIIKDEINANTHKEAREKLNELYQLVISGEIRLTDKIKELALAYFNECKNQRIKITIEDCQIAASSCMAGINCLATENRKTMMSPKSVEVFNSINAKKGLKTPKFIGYGMLKSLLFRSGIP